MGNGHAPLIKCTTLKFYPFSNAFSPNKFSSFFIKTWFLSIAIKKCRHKNNNEQNYGLREGVNLQETISSKSVNNLSCTPSESCDSTLYNI